MVEVKRYYTKYTDTNTEINYKINPITRTNKRLHIYNIHIWSKNIQSEELIRSRYDHGARYKKFRKQQKDKYINLGRNKYTGIKFKKKNCCCL